MNLPIIKSAPMARQVLTLGAATGAAVGHQAASAVSPRTEHDPEGWKVAAEAKIRQTLEQELAGKLADLQQAAQEKGYREGLASGHADGLAAGRDAFAQKVFLLEQIITKAEHAVEGWLSSVHQVAHEVAFDTMGRLLAEQALDPVMLGALVQKVIAPLRESDVLAIRLHPAEYHLLKQQLKQEGAFAALPARLGLKLQEDAGLASGGVAIDTPRGEYHATLDVLLGKLQGLLQARRAALGQPQDQVLPHALRA